MDTQRHLARDSGAWPSLGLFCALQSLPGTAPETGVWSRLAHHSSVPTVVATGWWPSCAHAGALIWDQDGQARGSGLETNLTETGRETVAVLVAALGTLTAPAEQSHPPLHGSSLRRLG